MHGTPDMSAGLWWRADPNALPSPAPSEFSRENVHVGKKRYATLYRAVLGSLAVRVHVRVCTDVPDWLVTPLKCSFRGRPLELLLFSPLLTTSTVIQQ